MTSDCSVGICALPAWMASLATATSVGRHRADERGEEGQLCLPDADRLLAIQPS
jgi:hypothetical protein